MFQVQRIDSIDLPELAPFRTLKRQQEQRDSGIFVAEGHKLVERLLRSPFQVISVLLPPPWLDRLEPLLAARSESIQVFLGDKPLLETLTGYSLYQGVLGMAKVPPPHHPAELWKKLDRPLALCALEGVSNAENVGAVMRNAVAFGIQALLCGQTTSSPYLRRAIRSSMGAVFDLAILEQLPLRETLQLLRENGCSIVAAEAHCGTASLADADLRSNVCLLFGGEGFGLSPELQSVADQQVTIPLDPRVDSLNVATAAALFFHELRRQRNNRERPA